MFIEERHQAILLMLAEAGSVTTTEIQKKFGISYDSAKRDLRLLEAAGKLRRTHGGAIPVGELSIGRAQSVIVPSVSESDNENGAAVAKYAASIINEDDVVFICSDALGVMLARHIPRGMRARVVTNSMSVAGLLYHREGIEVIFAGGELDKKGACADTFSCELIKRFRFDKAFVTSEGISPAFGVSVRRQSDLGLFSAVLDSARRVVGLYPPERVGAESAISVCPTSRLDVMLCEGNVPDKTRTAFEKCGVSVVLCD